MIIRTLITTYYPNQISRDKASNCVFHAVNDGGLFNPATDWDNHCQQVLDCFAGHSANYPEFDLYKDRIVEARCYDMADAIPRPEKAYKQWVQPVPSYQVSPPELAVVLSFFAARNIPGSRGRLYIGPLDLSSFGSVAQAHPPDALRTKVLALGHSLYDVGGSNVHHALYHAKTSKAHAAGTESKLTDYSVSDAWGVQRSRGTRPANRLKLTP